MEDGNRMLEAVSHTNLCHCYQPNQGHVDLVLYYALSLPNLSSPAQWQIPIHFITQDAINFALSRC